MKDHIVSYLVVAAGCSVSRQMFDESNNSMNNLAGDGVDVVAMVMQVKQKGCRQVKNSLVHFLFYFSVEIC